MKSRRGFTLIEVLVAAAVLGMAATALFGLFSKSLFNLGKIEELHRYELSAEDVMNRVLALSVLPAEGQAEGTLGNAGGRWAVSVHPWVSAVVQEGTIMKINVTVSWPGRSSRRSIQMEALKVARIAGSKDDMQKAIETVFPE